VCHWTARPEWSGDCGGPDGPGFDKSCRNCGSQCNQGCDINFSSTRLTLIAEQATIAQDTPVEIDLEAVRFLPEDCTCTSDAQCAESPDRTECVPGLFASEVCPTGASVCGVCTAPAPTCLPPLTLCNGRCVDTRTDEQNCGACNSACALDNAVTACVDSECRLVACDDGFGDADDEEGNGCECTITDGGDDQCDGIDNDCDGLTDWLMDPLPHSSCVCFDNALPVNRGQIASPSFPQQQCRPTDCKMLPSGAMEMSYCFNNCNSIFATCIVSGPVDLSTFDVDFGNEGILEVTFEVVSSSLAGKLNLNYGKHPRRKYVPLLAKGEVIPKGTYRKYFTPGQAKFASASPICTEACGSCPQIHNDPDFRFDASDITLVGEDCATSVDAIIRLQSLRLVSRGCGCISDADCTSNDERSACYEPGSGAGSCGWPSSAAPGMCGQATCDTNVPLGSPCQVTVTNMTCAGTWQCRGGAAVCEVSSCG
jgi:hypothetical protein